MKRKTLVDLVVAISLIILGSVILTFPLFKGISAKYIFMGVLAFYGISNLFQFLLTSKEKDYEGLLTMIASIIALLILGFIQMPNSPMNLALTLFVWIVLMSLIKLKKADYYHDRGKKIWILRVMLLVLFILIGLLSVINLYENDMQILVLGYFYFVHGLLEIIDPITNYLMEDSKK